MKKILIIGCGAMGGAILSGCLAKGLWKKEEVFVKEHSLAASEEKAARYGVSVSKEGGEAGEADLVIVAVKPNVVPSVLEELSRHAPRRVLSIAAAVTIETLEKASEGDRSHPCHAEYPGLCRRRHGSDRSGDIRFGRIHR